MDVTPLIRPGAQVIQAYAGGIFRISGVVYESAVIVTPEGVVRWDIAGIEDLKHDSFQSIDCDILLLGTGKAMKFLTPDMRKGFKDRGLSVDAMATDAACRTYNVLMAEGRRIAAAMLPYI